jgi:hypothetical protein
MDTKHKSNKEKLENKKVILENNEIYKKLLKDENLSFVELCSIIKKTRVKEITSIFLRGVFGNKSKHPQFKAELFLSLFLIYRFHNIVFEGEGTDMVRQLLELVREIIHIMQTDILENRNLIMHKLIEFKEKFQIWKNMDLNQQVKLYSETYYELELLKLKMTENKEVNLIYRESIIPLQTKIKRVVVYLAGERGLAYLENYKTQHLKLTVVLEKKLRENLRKAFWNKLATDLLEEPANYSQIPGLFKDIQKLYMSILSCINNKEKRETYEKEFNSLIDINYIVLLLNTGGLNDEIILNNCVNILEQTKEIGIPKNDSKIAKMVLKIKKELDKDKPEMSDLCSIFKLIIKLLEELQTFFMNRMINKAK